MGLSKEQQAQIEAALDAGKQALIAERDAAEDRLRAEASVREAFGDADGAAHLRNMCDLGRQATDQMRDS